MASEGARGAAEAPGSEGRAEGGPGKAAVGRLVWTILVLSGLLFVAYGVVAASLGFFAVVDFRYLHRPDTILYYFPQVQIESMLWKLVLLLPAGVLLALGLSAFGVRPRLVRPGREVRLLAILSLVAVGIIVLLIRFAFRGTEITDDEITYDFQAKTLLMGRLSNPPPRATTSRTSSSSRTTPTGWGSTRSGIRSWSRWGWRWGAGMR